MNFYRIKNNTNNSIIVNGTYIGPASEAILSDDVINLIDKQYFDSGILANLGVVSIEQSYVMIDTKTVQFYKKPPTGIPKRHLDDDVKTSLNKADKALQPGNVKMEDLHITLQKTIKSIMNSDSNASNNPRGTFNSPQSLLIKESQLEKSVRDKLNAINDISYKIYSEGLDWENLSSEIRYLLENINTDNTSYWKEPVATVDLLPTENNKNGDIRLVLEELKFYKWNENISSWEFINIADSNSSSNEIDIPINLSSYTDIIGEFFARENQTIFTAQKPYGLGTDNLQVLLNGLLMMKDVDYKEIDDRTIEFLSPLEEDDYVLMCVINKNEKDVKAVVENIVIDKTTRIVKLNYAYQPGIDTIKVYLNGVLMNSGFEEDYIEIDSNTIKFNFDLCEGDKLIIRFDPSLTDKILENKFASVQKVYLNLAKQIELLKKEVREKLGGK